MNKDEVMEIINKMSEQMTAGNKVFISPLPEVVTIGTIETKHGNIQMYYDPMLPKGSFYLMDKDDFDNRF